MSLCQRLQKEFKISYYTSSNIKCRERSINSTKNKEKFQIASTGNSLYADVNEEKIKKKKYSLANRIPKRPSIKYLNKTI